MQDENEQPQEDVVVEEEVTTPEETVETEETQDDTITLDKSEYKKLVRQSMAYKATKDTQVKPVQQPKQDGHSIDTLFLIKDLAADEYVSLKEEADDLAVPLERYLTSNSGKSLLNNMRADKKRADEKTSLTSKSPVYKKYTQADLNTMTSKEMEKIMPR